MSKFWKFIYNAATENNNESVELRIDGDFIDSENAWIYEWFGISVASPNAFRKELSQYSGKDIKVWIDSYGGSVFAGIGIYNALMEHKNTGAKITTVADSKVMSAATIPFQAGDERFMSPGAMYMMHNPLTGAQGYASDLRKAADVLDEVKESIINIYQSSTGLSREKISTLMDNETYWGAKKAIAEGFATGMLYADDAQINDKAGSNNILNFSFNRLAIQNAASDSFKSFFEIAKKVSESAPQAQATEPQPVANINNKEEGDKPMFKNVEELRNACPDLVKQIEDAAREDGAKEERGRIQNIERISKNLDPKLVNKAKFEEPMNAEKLAFEALQADNGKGQQYLKNAAEDSQESGANEVTASPTSHSTDEEKKEAENKAIENIAAGANKRRGR